MQRSAWSRFPPHWTPSVPSVLEISSGYFAFMAVVCFFIVLCNVNTSIMLLKVKTSQNALLRWIDSLFEFYSVEPRKETCWVTDFLLSNCMFITTFRDYHMLVWSIINLKYAHLCNFISPGVVLSSVVFATEMGLKLMSNN